MPSGYESTADARAAFIADLAQSGNITKSAEAVGLTRHWAYKLRDRDPEFGAQVAEALAEATERLEAEARRRAFDGFTRPIYQGGKLVGEERVYSDQLMVTLLRAHGGPKYRDRVGLEHSTPPGQPLEVRHEVPVALEEPLRKLAQQAARGSSAVEVEDDSAEEGD